MPADRPVGLRRSQVPFVPKMERENRLKLKCILGRPIWRRVCERYWVLRDETDQQPRDSGVNGAKRRTGLPRALTRAPAGGGGKNERWSDSNQEPAFLPVGPREHRDIENGQVAELGTGPATRTWNRN